MNTASPRMPSPLTAGITRLAFYLQVLSLLSCNIKILQFWIIQNQYSTMMISHNSQNCVAVRVVVALSLDQQVIWGSLNHLQVMYMVNSPCMVLLCFCAFVLSLSEQSLVGLSGGRDENLFACLHVRKTYKSPCLHLSVNSSFQN